MGDIVNIDRKAVNDTIESIGDQMDAADRAGVGELTRLMFKMIGDLASQTARPRRLAVVDAAGRERIVLDGSGEVPSIAILDADGTPSLVLEAFDGGPTVIRLGTHGSGLALLTASEGGASVELHDGEREFHAFLAAGDTAAPDPASLTVWTRKGEIEARWPADAAR